MSQYINTTTVACQNSFKFCGEDSFICACCVAFLCGIKLMISTLSYKGKSKIKGMHDFERMMGS